MNKYSLPTILFAGLLLAGCSHSSGLWDKEDVESALKQQYGDTTNIAVSEGCGSGAVQIAGLPCPQLLAAVGKTGAVKGVYYFYSGTVPRDLFPKIIGMPGSRILYYSNSDTLHLKQLVVSGVDSTEEKIQDQVAKTLGLRKLVIQDVQLEDVERSEQRNEPPPPPPPPMVDSSAKKKPNK
ncbi:MAG TPA: hypothetical protein VGM41_08570, partial [Chitinophagaceae bacterium]